MYTREKVWGKKHSSDLDWTPQIDIAMSMQFVLPVVKEEPELSEEQAFQSMYEARDAIMAQIGQLSGKFMAPDLKKHLHELKKKADDQLTSLTAVISQRKHLQLRLRRVVYDASIHPFQDAMFNIQRVRRLAVKSSDSHSRNSLAAALRWPLPAMSKATMPSAVPLTAAGPLHRHNPQTLMQ